MRKIIRGGTDRSYGIHVAKLAGVPAKVLRRSESILKRLIKEGGAGIGVSDVTSSRTDDNSNDNDVLYDFNPIEPMKLRLEEGCLDVLERIKNADIDNMTPVKAFAFLSELKEELGNIDDE